MKENDLKLLKECILDWESGKLSGFTAMVIVSNIVFPEPTTEIDVRWGQEVAKKLRLV